MPFRMRSMASLPLVSLTLLLLRVAFVVARTQVDPRPDPGLLRCLEIFHSPPSDGSNEVEYGILDLGLVRIIAADDLVQAWITIHWLMLVCDMWIWTILHRTWGAMPASDTSPTAFHWSG